MVADLRAPIRANAVNPEQKAAECRFCNCIRQRFGRWFALAQYGFPFAIGFPASAVARFRAGGRARYAHRSAGARLLIYIAMTAGWPVGAFLTAHRTIARMRTRGQRPCGRRVLLDMYWLALRYSIPPLEYALYRLNEPDRRRNVHDYVYWNDLPALAALVARAGAHIWEVFFLIQVGRGTATEPLSPAGHEDVCHFLYDASAYGFIVRTVEAPFFRRIVQARQAGGPVPGSALYEKLSTDLTGLLGPATRRPSAHTTPTRDGKGIVFIAHDGQVYPAGFLPRGLGSIRTRPLNPNHTTSV